MITRDMLSLLSCVPLMVLILWQGSSCHSTKANKNSTGNVNHSMNTNATLPQGSDLKGVWGAQGVSMQVTDAGAQISYDCAHGSISEKIVLDAQGRFSARGHHANEHPGPVRVDEDQNGKAASYRGTVTGNTMELTVTLADSNEVVGTFTLTHGTSGRIRRCL